MDETSFKNVFADIAQKVIPTVVSITSTKIDTVIYQDPFSQFFWGSPFEDFFATPQEADFARLCAAHGVEHVLVRDWAHFGELGAKLPATGLRVLEVRTDRKRDAAFRRMLFDEVTAELG